MQNHQPEDTLFESHNNQPNQNVEINIKTTNIPSIDQKKIRVRYNPAIHGPDKKLFKQKRKHEHYKKSIERNQKDPLKRERFLKMKSEISLRYRIKRAQDPQRAQKERDRQKKSARLHRALKKQQQQQQEQDKQE